MNPSSLRLSLTPLLNVIDNNFKMAEGWHTATLWGIPGLRAYCGLYLDYYHALQAINLIF